MTLTKTPSDKQAAIYLEWKTTDKNILIQAVAGSGKTTTLMDLMGLCGKDDKILYLAFNKDIQQSTQAKINELGIMGRAQTLHSLGYEAIRHTHHKVEVETDKNWKIMDEVARRHPRYFSMKSGIYTKYEEILRLKFTLMDMNNVSRSYMEDDPDTIFELMTEMDKSFFLKDEIDIGLLWEEFISVREEKYSYSPLVIDLEDMIYLPARGNYHIPVQPKYLMLDECQDFNFAQHTLIDNLINQGDIEKWIAVGDRNQAIYGFSGAHAGSFDLFKKKNNVKEMPLDICYRCPRQVIHMANRVYDVMIPFKKEEGEVKVLHELKNFAKTPNAMVICRNKAPLFDLYFDLVEGGVPAKLVGNDIKDNLIRFLSSYKKMTIHAALIDISKELSELSENMNTEQKKIRYAVMKENKENFITLASRLHFLGRYSVESLIERFKQLFEGGSDMVTLCTIHKSKGLEADHVYILNENLIPSQFAKSPQQLVQEENLKYVARTRAKKSLYFLYREKSNNNNIEY